MISFGYCQCGCGQLAPISDRNRPDQDAIKGQPRKFIHGHQSVKSYDQLEMEFWASFRFIPGPLESFCWLWTGFISSHGYGGAVNKKLCDERSAHRAAYVLVRGPIPKHLELDHLCRNRACINPWHLEAVTRTINARRGAKTKLTLEQVEEIRELKLSRRKIARLYGVHDSTIDAIRRGRSWVN